MYYQPFEPRKKKGRRWLWLVLLLVMGSAAGGAGYLYGPRLYYAVTGDAQVRLEKRAGEFEKRLQEWDGGNAGVSDLLIELDEIRRIAEIQERNNPADATVYYYHALLDFYELVIRMPLNGPSLLQLTGRGYLPLQKSLDSVPEAGIPRLSQRIARNVRKALALDPGLSNKATAYLMLVYGDLFFTERTDENLLRMLTEIFAGDEISPALLRYRDWIGLAMYSLSGSKQEMQTLAADVVVVPVDASGAGITIPGAAPAEPSADGAAAASVHRLQLDENVRDLVLCHGFYYARDFLPALRLARQVKYRPGTPAILQAEAVRMEGEIFLLQRGQAAACYFFEEAQRLGEDPFVTERIQALCVAGP